MEERKLDFEKNKVEVLTLDELKQTYMEVTPNGTPTFGYHHYECLEKILIELEKVCKPHVSEIFAANNGDSRYPGVSVIRDLVPQMGEGSLGVHTLRRVYSNIETGVGIDNGITLNVAFSYNQRGIQIGVGPHVHVCHNQSILGAQYLFSTYSICGAIHKEQSYKSFDEVFGAFSKFVENFQSEFKNIIDEYESLKKQQYDMNAVLAFFGYLLRHRVMFDTKEKNYKTSEIYPLSGVQLNMAMERFCIYDAENKPQALSGWDLINLLNTDMKPERADIPSLMSHMIRLVYSLNNFKRAYYGTESV